MAYHKKKGGWDFNHPTGFFLWHWVYHIKLEMDSGG